MGKKTGEIRKVWKKREFGKISKLGQDLMR